MFFCVFLVGISAAQEVPTQQTPSARTVDEIEKNNQPLIPEGFLISDRRAKLVSHPKDFRWFLMFEKKVELW